MFVFSLFLWPSPAVALVGAIVLPIAVQSGLTPLAAAMAMNLFGHGFALSYDAVIQGAPAISAGAADISTTDILSKGRPLFWIMGITCVCSAFLLNRMTLAGQRKNEDQRNDLKITDLPEKQEDSGEETPEEKGIGRSNIPPLLRLWRSYSHCFSYGYPVYVLIQIKGRRCHQPGCGDCSYSYVCGRGHGV